MAVTQQRLTEVDPAFPVPPNVVDIRQLNKEDGSEYYEEVEAVEEDLASEGPGSAIPMPIGFSVFEQRVRITSDGRAVVDVTLEFEDTNGITDIELAVTKL